MLMVMRAIAWACAAFALASCDGGGGGGNNSGANPATGGAPIVDNSVPVAISGVFGFANIGYVSVTLCEPGTSNCTTIDNVLVDTGSSGLRILESALATLNLPARNHVSGQPIFECFRFVDLSHAWGPMKIADVRIGNLTALGTNIQAISSAVIEPAACGGSPDNLDSTAKLGANGILGVGYYVEDCGQFCELTLNNTFYYVCPAGLCSNTTASAAFQVQNPAARFPGDNNGVVIQLPAVPGSGAAGVSGSLIFGIGTRGNNSLGNAARYTLDTSGYIRTRFNGIDYPRSFVDSGSNGLYFPNTLSLPTCTVNADFYCPSSTVNLSATVSGAAGSSATGSVDFSVANAEQLSGSFSAFNNLAGVYGGGFDWGMPFFLGRRVYTGFETNPGGPYVAY